MGKLATMDNNKMPNKRSWQQAIAEWAQRNAKYIAMFGTACLLSVAACNNGGEKVKGEEAGVEKENAVKLTRMTRQQEAEYRKTFHDICESYHCTPAEARQHMEEAFERNKENFKENGEWPTLQQANGREFSVHMWMYNKEPLYSLEL